MMSDGRLGVIARLCAATLALLLAAGPLARAWSDDREQGIGGTGAPIHRGGTGGLEPGGLAGTGITGGDEDKGIGGTGVFAGGADQGIGGTGIIGVITGFGSIIVNGLTIVIGANAVVEDLDGAVRREALRLGHLVEVEASEGPDGRLTARTISIRHDVAGPVERIDRDRGAVLVLGQWAYAVPETLVIPYGQGGSADATTGTAGLARLRLGETIRISGLRREDGALAATRIEPHPATSPFALRGTVSGVEQGSVEIDGVPVRIEGHASARVGDTLLLRGDAVGGRLRARRIRRIQDLPFGGRVRRLIVEGIAARRGQTGWHLNGYGLGAEAGAEAGAKVGGDLRPGQRVVGEWRLGRDRRLKLARTLCKARDRGRLSRLRDCSRLGEARPRNLRKGPGDDSPSVESPIREKRRELLQERRERRLRRRENGIGEPPLPERWRERRRERLEKLRERRRHRERDSE